MLQLKTPLIDQSRAVEPKAPAAQHEIYYIVNSAQCAANPAIKHKNRGAVDYSAAR